ncbi:hypothetical protein [Pseudomonas sichuanensis]|uniref:hypothetical protein n=1 Tax=Pseudomonas sichuanensis TaxID=2213015 RepID=UPI0036F13026
MDRIEHVWLQAEQVFGDKGKAAAWLSDAMKRYYEAQQAKLPDEDVERMRLKAEALFRAVNEFQQRMLGRRFDTLH